MPAPEVNDAATYLDETTLESDHARPRSSARIPFDPDTKPPRLGRYVLLRELGRNLAGAVYAAYHEGLERKLALKVLNKGRADRTDLEARLRREARALAKLSHPNVVQVYDVGEFEGRVFVAMEFVEGETLREWMLDDDHEIGEIIEMFADIGRGLGAAHEAGVIHRDFKPDSVRVASDGRPRVLDFGLAVAPEPEDPSAGPSAPGPHAAARTPDPAIVDELGGSPAYMSPEQARGQPVDQASDQFSFCVALHEAVYGQRPIVGQTGEFIETRDHSAVPARLRGLIVRGLAPTPSERFESMRELVEALQHEHDDPPRRWVAGLVIALVAGLMLGAWALRPEPDSPCPSAEDSAAKLWGPAQASELRQVFERSPLPYADHTWSAVEPRIAAWARSWAERRVEACTATHVRQEFSAEVLALREGCLDRQLRSYTSLIEQLAVGDATAIARALEATAALPDPARCGDVDALLSQGSAPIGPVADEIEQLRAELATIDTLANLGRWRLGLERAETTVERARATAHGPLLAEARFAHARLLAGQGQDQAAIEELQAALDEAERSGHDRIIPQIAIELVAVSASAGSDPARARIWARRAMAGLDHRVGDESGPTRAIAMWRRGQLEHLAGDEALAETLLREALALLDEHAPRNPQRAAMVHDLGEVLLANGELEAAHETLSAALDGRAQTFGLAHPQVAHTRSSLARVELARDHVDEAIAHYLAALTIQQQALPADHPSLISTHTELGLVYLSRGEAEAARVELTRAVALLEANTQADPDQLRHSRLLLGDALLARAGPGDARRSASTFERAFEGCEAPSRSCADLALRLAKANADTSLRETAARWARRASTLYEALEGDFDAQLRETAELADMAETEP